jgi:hypothetical protein
VTVLVCLLLYHTPCPAVELPTTGNVIDGLQYAMSAPPPDPPWWPLWTLASR